MSPLSGWVAIWHFTVVCIKQHTKHSFCMELSELLNENMISAFWSRIREFFTICEKFVKFSQWGNQRVIVLKTINWESNLYTGTVFGSKNIYRYPGCICSSHCEDFAEFFTNTAVIQRSHGLLGIIMCGLWRLAKRFVTGFTRMGINVRVIPTLSWPLQTVHNPK